MPGQSGQVQTSYFVCPKLPPTGTATGEEEKRYCCGPVTQQFCCSAAEFTAGVRIISPAQVVSPSVIIGASLAFLLVATLLTIIAYSRIARGLRKQSSRMQCQANSSSGYPAHRGYSSKNSLSSSHIPPSKQLISNKGISSSVEKQVEVKQTRLPNENKEALNPKQPPALRLLTGDTVPHPTKQTVSARPAKKQPYNRRSRT
ncbi:jumonji domain-containing protein 2 [Clonorchis sinensis]|uniref:Jumonji domain-containing protein 2 n=1 Tax=Clonorchis sinensis TaxID=79923 RepID=G7YAM9_CLOSI|nr:jumonji domain-containing protein 2 [Clonorchis sinensis]